MNKKYIQLNVLKYIVRGIEYRGFSPIEATDHSVYYVRSVKDGYALAPIVDSVAVLYQNGVSLEHFVSAREFEEFYENVPNTSFVRCTRPHTFVQVWDNISFDKKTVNTLDYLDITDLDHIQVIPHDQFKENYDVLGDAEIDWCKIYVKSQKNS